jgi:tetratricopeptide (TPR) repeat protein
MSELRPEPAQTPDLNKKTEVQPDSASETPTALPIVICVLLAIITLFTFWPAVHSEFVNLDDPDYVSNPHVQNGLTFKGIVWAFGTWHPVTWISHMLDAQFFGNGPEGPHLVNLLLHVANSVLLFLVLRRLFTAVKGGTNAESRIDGIWPAVFVAAMFALHPIQVESVAWVAERKGVLSMFFGLLCLWAYARYVGKKDAREGEKSEIRNSKFETSSKFEIQSPKAYYVLALVFFGLGLLSKPMLVTLPILFLLLDFWPLRRVSNVEIRALVVEKVPFLALAVGGCILTLVTQSMAGAFQSLEYYSAGSRFENALMSYMHYLGTIFWPVGLSTPYARRFHWPFLEVALAALVLLGLCVTAFWQRRKWPFLAVGWFWFFVALIPVNGVIQAAAQGVADRYMYLPSIGLFILATSGVCAIVARGRVPKTVCGVVGGILLLACAGRTRDQVAVWKNSETLFKQALAVNKNNVIAQYNLGVYYHEHGRLNEAAACYRRTLELKPDYADALNNIGFLLTSQARYGEAIQYFEAALKARPDAVEARNNIGRVLCMAGRTDEGIAQYRLALKSKPDHVGVLNNLGNVLAQRRQFREAIPCYEASLRADPDQSVAQYGLGHALDSIGERDKAIEHYRSAVQLSPKYAEPHYDLGLALARKGEFQESVEEFRRAVQLKPNNPMFQFGLGKALAVSQKFDESIVAYKEGLRFAPTNAEAFSGIGSALATKGDLAQAVPYFKQSVHLRPENPFTHYFLAKALASQGKFDEATPQYAEALRLKPDFGEAKQELDAIHAKGR